MRNDQIGYNQNEESQLVGHRATEIARERHAKFLGEIVTVVVPGCPTLEGRYMGISDDGDIMFEGKDGNPQGDYNVQGKPYFITKNKTAKEQFDELLGKKESSKIGFR